MGLHKSNGSTIVSIFELLAQTATRLVSIQNVSVVLADQLLLLVV